MEFAAMPELLKTPVASAPESRPLREHTHWQALLFSAKAWAFRAQRIFDNFCDGAVERFSAEPASAAAGVAFESRSLLYSSDTAAEFTLQAGKVQNLRVAAACLDGVVIPAREVFSFWEHVGRPVRSRGFTEGRELREGCIIPSVGGGLCQLSNALYDAALSADCEIVERHAHSRKLPGSMAVADRDATVFWNYVDLRFRPQSRCRLEVHLTQRELVVRLNMLDGKGNVRSRKVQPRSSAHAPASEQDRADLLREAHSTESCETCEMTQCFRHSPCAQLTTEGCTAWLVDAWWPEFDRYLQSRRSSKDWLFLPLDSRRWRVGSYRWNTEGFSQTQQALWETITRSLQSRRLASQGAERQRALLRFDEALARRFARSLPASATHLVVSLNLLPFLWRDGVLGGRTFDVLMTRQPMASLQATLDLAQQRHPASPTLGDFRASPELMEAESAALAEARRWITPHRAIAELGGKRSVLLDWHFPSARPKPRAKSRIVFPASTLGRKGAYELREAAQRLGLTVVLGGRVIEDPHFWSGVKVEPAGDDWLANVGAVALPAWVEHQPRRLLQAVAAGVPVIASKACGLEDAPGVTTIFDGDVAALEEALRKVLEC